ncbi:MAG: DnaJ family domain-containing protein [Desulfobaccales bacterium]
MESFQRIAENRILEAIDNGLFDNLQGKGKPLKFADDSHIPLELRMAYKILKNADCLPPELELRKEIVQLQDLVASLPDTAEKLKQMRRLNFLIMKMDMTRPVSAQLLEHDLYTPKVLDRLQSKPGKP